MTRFFDMLSDRSLIGTEKEKPRTVPRLNYRVKSDVSNFRASHCVLIDHNFQLVELSISFVEDQVLHASISQFLTRLAK